MEEELHIIIEHLQTQRNDAHNMACNLMLQLTKANKRITELAKQVEDLTPAVVQHEEEVVPACVVA